jgi:hypothetical protein
MFATYYFLLGAVFEVEKESNPGAMPRRKKNAAGCPPRTNAVSSLTHNGAAQSTILAFFLTS